MEDQSPQATPAQRALRIPELLEVVLLHLSLGDLLYNAQRVNKFWRSCIGIHSPGGKSHALRQKCFLSAKVMTANEEMPDPLFLNPSGPSDIRTRRNLLMYKYEKFLRKTDNAPFTFREIRKYFTEHYMEDSRRLVDYMFEVDCLVTAATEQEHTHLNPLCVDNFMQNCPNKTWASGHYMLDNTKRHPFLDCFDEVDYFWTGYSSHLLFFIGDRHLDSFRQIKQIMEVLSFLVNTEPAGATWKRGMITQPACTKVTVYTRTGDIKLEVHETFLNSNGVTVEELFQLIAGACKKALSAVSDERMEARFQKMYEEVARDQRDAIVAVSEFEELMGNLSLGS